jgi:hypothetical protein
MAFQSGGVLLNDLVDSESGQRPALLRDEHRIRLLRWAGPDSQPSQ